MICTSFGFKYIMLNCQYCLVNQITPLLTKCCKYFLCRQCIDRHEKKQSCFCGKNILAGKKMYNQNPQILEMIKRIKKGQRQECDRCSTEAQFQCIDCQMNFCETCNTQIHNSTGYSKHQSQILTKTTVKHEKISKPEANCKLHNEKLTIWCECSAALCQSCLKGHKQICNKPIKSKPSKQLKQEYFYNILIKQRQLTQFKEKLSQDKQKYDLHFKQQTNYYLSTEKLITQQFQTLAKIIDVKFNEAKSKLNSYWNNCKQAYQNHMFKIDNQLSKYDQYSELLHLFSEHFISLQYFQKKIKKTNIPFEFVNIKLIGIDLVQQNIMNIKLVEKQWQNSMHYIPSADMLQQKSVLKEDPMVLGGIKNTSELLVEYSSNALKDRSINLLPSHTEILFSFIHLPYQQVSYEIQYGVGMKLKGLQIFKKMTNHNGYGIIQGLNPNTKYRIRMRVCQSQWGPISQITTLDIPKFNIENSLSAKTSGENIQLNKGGQIYGSNQIYFGVHRWIIKLTSKNISYEDSQMACMSVGVSNKQSKKVVFVGTTFNYGYQKHEIILKVSLDCTQKKMIITNITTNIEQIYHNLPNFPILPTIQNKGNGQITVRYSLINDQLN